jgi:hypothetical protein
MDDQLFGCLLKGVLFLVTCLCILFLLFGIFLGKIL